LGTNDKSNNFLGLNFSSHLEVASFLASLVKACLMFEHETIPPTANLLSPSPAIDWGAFRVSVPVEPTPLGCRSSSGRSIISLSSFGVGGAMGHVVLQAPPPTPTTEEFSTRPILFVVGGLSSNAVEQISRGVLEMGSGDLKALRECAVTLSRRARQFPWRKYFIAPTSAHTPIAPPTLIPSEAPPISFVFSGQGPQYFEMGRQLFEEYPVFRNTIVEMDEVYRRVRGVSLIQSTGLFSPAGLRSVAPTVFLHDSKWPATITHSAITMVQMALFDLLKSLGVVPNMMLGHSAGETAVLYASGAGPKEMAMEIAIARGEAMKCTESETVGMATLASNADEVSALIWRVTANEAGVLEISCLNSPQSTSVSGTANLLDKLVVLAKSEGISAQRLRTMVPGHSSLMDCIKQDYLARMDDIFARYPGSHVPLIPVYSTCRKEEFVDSFSPNYFWDNCRNAVLFSKATSHSLATSPIFLEISCHQVLSTSILGHGVPMNRVLCPMRRMSANKSPSVALTELEFLLGTLGRLSLLGVNLLDLTGLYGPSRFKPQLIDHPLTDRSIPPPKSSLRAAVSTIHNSGPLSSSNLYINHASHPDLAQHVINGAQDILTVPLNSLPYRYR
jgi:acyl transferase domain-containing protein